MFDFTQLTTAELQDAQAAIAKVLADRKNSDRKKAAFAVVEALDNYIADWGEIKCRIRNDYSDYVGDSIGEERSAASFLDEITYADFMVAPNGTLEFKIDVE